MNPDNRRTRLVSWHDPSVTASAFVELCGLEFLQRIAVGDLPPPPISQSLNFFLTEVGQGLAVFTVMPEEYHYNPIGTVHGGLAATLIDSALSCAVQTLLPAGKGYTIVELKLNYIRPLTQRTSLIRSIGTVIHQGRLIATAEAKVIDEQDKLVAHDVGTCLIYDL
jgi:uncharacterized protein (TIGR00369 family)